jgi:hypothetical protein
MQTTKTSDEQVALNDERIVQPFSRRKFLGYVGATSALLATAASCKKDPVNNNTGVDLGSGDVGILNYAYALEQLEAAFYTQVVATPYSGITAAETEFMTDIRNHEIAHREFFKTAITGAAPSSVIPGLEVDFSTINFSSRTSVLGTAMAFEDLGVSAYDGAGYLLKSGAYLLLAGKIVSVEARHAALIRELISPNSFLGDQVDGNSVNISRTPAEVLAIAGTYIKTKINASNLPTG